jgi:hypothetical protein
MNVIPLDPVLIVRGEVVPGGSYEPRARDTASPLTTFVVLHCRPELGVA